MSWHAAEWAQDGTRCDAAGNGNPRVNVEDTKGRTPDPRIFGPTAAMQPRRPEGRLAESAKKHLKAPNSA
eukprot:12121689-Alexandrium_andersonii.AAC.1